MDPDTIQLLYGYNLWVNQRLLAMAEEVPPERLRESFGASFDTILGTLAHLLSAEINWLGRWRGVNSAVQLTASDFDSLDAFRTRWQEQQGEMDGFLAGITSEKLAALVHYKNAAGTPYVLPLGQLMLHAANHATHHRSELADMLTRVGLPPKPTDLVRYCLELTGQG